MSKREGSSHNFIKENIKKQIILTCPHDGHVIPFGVPPRDRSKLPDSCDEPFVLKGDLNTSKLTAAIAKKISVLRKKDVCVEIGTIKRHYCDLNRCEECAFDDLRVKNFYRKYHNSISTQINEMHSNIKKER
jgi:hypothetical protein